MGKWMHRVVELNLELLCHNLRSVRGRLRSRISSINKFRWNCQRYQASNRTIIKGRSVSQVAKWFTYNHHNRMLSQPSSNFLSTQFLISKWLNFRVSITFLKLRIKPSSKISICHQCRFWTTENLRMVSIIRVKGKQYRTRITQCWIHSSSTAKSNSMETCTTKSLMESMVVVSEWFHLLWWRMSQQVRSPNLTSSKLLVKYRHSTTRID